MCRQQVSSEINISFPPQGTVFSLQDIICGLLKSAGEQMLSVAVTISECIPLILWDAMEIAL